MPDLKTILGGGGLDDTVWSDARAGNLDSVPAILTDTAALDGRLTDTRAGKLDNLDASISGIPAAVAAQVGGGGMQVKSIQSGYISSLVTYQGKSTTISSVDTGKSVLIFSFTTNGNVSSFQMMRGTFTSSTELTFYMSGTYDTTLFKVNWFVIEYE